MRTHTPLLGHMSTSEHPSFKGTSGSCTRMKAQCWADFSPSLGPLRGSLGEGFWEAPHYPSQLSYHPGDALGGSLKQNSQSLIHVLVRNQILGPTPTPPQT